MQRGTIKQPLVARSEIRTVLIAKSGTAALPTREWIDAVTPDNPVFLSRYDGHMALANSLAMKLAESALGDAASGDPPQGDPVREGCQAD